MPIGCVRFARYCGKMYSHHLFPYGGLVFSMYFALLFIHVAHSQHLTSIFLRPCSSTSVRSRFNIVQVLFFVHMWNKMNQHVNKWKNGNNNEVWSCFCKMIFRFTTWWRHPRYSEKIRRTFCKAECEDSPGWSVDRHGECRYIRWETCALQMHVVT